VGVVMAGLLPLTIYLLGVVLYIAITPNPRTSFIEKSLLIISATGPSLGLMGTAIGTMEGSAAFSLGHGIKNLLEAVAALLAGLSEALLTTIWGTMIGTPAIILRIALFHGKKQSDSTPEPDGDDTQDRHRGLIDQGDKTDKVPTTVDRQPVKAGFEAVEGAVRRGGNVIYRAFNKKKTSRRGKCLEIPAESDPAEDAMERIVAPSSKDVVQAFEQYGVTGLSAGEEYHEGPVSLFEMMLAPGVPIKTLQNLEKEIAFTIGERSVQVQPGSGSRQVRVEVTHAEMKVGSVWEGIRAVKAELSRYDVPCLLGRDLYGRTRVFDLATGPHLLIAGSTGSGKTSFEHSCLHLDACCETTGGVKTGANRSKRGGVSLLCRSAASNTAYCDTSR